MEGTLNLVGFGLSAIGPAIATGMIFAAYIALALFGLVLAFVL